MQAKPHRRQEQQRASKTVRVRVPVLQAQRPLVALRETLLPGRAMSPQPRHKQPQPKPALLG
jgi:hypothetical protein